MTRRVAVLMGGRSAEREVSLVSGKACARRSRGARLPRHPDRCRPRSARGAGGGAAGCRVQCAARPFRRGRTRAGPARPSRAALHPFRRAGLGAGHGQAHGQARVRQRRPALPRGRGDHARPAAGRPAAGAAVRGQAGGRGLQRRRGDRARRRSAPAHRPQRCRPRLPAPGRALRPRPRADLRGARRRAPGGHRDPAQSRLLRLPRQIHRGFATHLVPGAAVAGAVRGGDGRGAEGPSRARLPRRQPRRLPPRPEPGAKRASICSRSIPSRA